MLGLLFAIYFLFTYLYYINRKKGEIIMADKNKYINASPLDRKIQKNITKAQTQEKKHMTVWRHKRMSAVRI